MKKPFAYWLSLAWFILKYAFIIIVFGLVALLIALGGAYRDLRAAGELGLAGKNNISAAIAAAKNKDWLAAQTLAAQASTEFKESLASLEASRSNPAIQKFGPIRSQINDLSYLLQTATILSGSMERGLPIVSELNKISAASGSNNFVDLPETDKGRFLKLIYESEPELNGLKANIDLALLNLNKIHKIGILWPIYGQISDIRQELVQASELLEKTTPLIKLLPALAGYPDTSRFLLILQNNDELRPTGGFIGVYGILETKNGAILSIDTDDSYHIDMPASLSDRWTLPAPEPLKKYLNVEKWYFRDSNWSPDWPTAAAQVAAIYQGENEAIGNPVPPFTGIIAITPDFVGDLLNLVGPIVVRGETYDATNFQPLLQYNVEIAYKDQAISPWDRKDIVDELMGELKSRLFQAKADKLNELIKIVNSNITEKNLQAYFLDAGWQSLGREAGISGEMKQSGGDYLMVVDANLGAFKSDAVIRKDISYVLSQENNGLSATVRLDYAHEGGFDWRTTRYRSYTRVYAPLGSRMLALDNPSNTVTDFSVTDDQNLKKTVFGFFWVIEPGTTQAISINYLLPQNLTDKTLSQGYELLIQKQAGQRINKLQVINKINKKIIIKTDFLKSDQFFGQTDWQ